MSPIDPEVTVSVGLGDWIEHKEFLLSSFQFVPKWLQESLQSLLKFTSRTSSNHLSGGDGLDPSRQMDPRLRKLVEGILYSRSFIVTYHLVVIGFVAIITLQHWVSKVIRWRKFRARDIKVPDRDNVAVKRIFYKRLISHDVGFASSSGSSTLEGAESPPIMIRSGDERTDLLKGFQVSRFDTHQPSIWFCFHALLMYQPPPFPIFLQRDKILPSTGTCIIIFAFIGLNIFYTLHHINFTLMELFVLADRCGLVFIANLPLLYLCSAKTQPLKFLTGNSYEVLNIFHRRLGEILCLEAFLHALGMVLVWYTLLRPTGFVFFRFIFNKTILTGLGAFIAFEVLYGTARPFFRHLWYELFLGLHVSLQTAALVFLFFHHPESRIYTGMALGIFVLDRLVYRVSLKTTTQIADVQVMDDGETVRLSTVFNLNPKKVKYQIFGNITSGWNAADHVFLTIPSLGRTHFVQAHPFTIASPAPKVNSNDATLELLIRSQRGFSLDLLEAATQQSRLTVRIDGPYGSSYARSLLSSSDVAIVIAGGSGIAVAWPLINFLLDQRESVDTRVMSEAQSRRQRIVLVWIVHSSPHFSWVQRPDLQDAEDKGAEIILPPATEEGGRPDIGGIIDDVIKEAGSSARIGVVGSGPESMGRVVRNTCARLAWNGRKVDVVIEKFGW